MGAPGSAPGAYNQPAPPMPSAAPGGEIRGDFSGTGGELFGQLIVGAILTVITFYIYMPWFMCKMLNFMAERTTFGPTAKGMIRFRFEGKGGDLFVLGLVQGLLTVITLYIYMPWAMCKILSWYTENFVATDEQGGEYRLRFEGNGGDLFVTFIVGAILTVVTLYIYMPWFMCKMYRWFADHIKVTKNGQDIGNLEFVGEGGDFFVLMLINGLLTAITFYIYMPWAWVNVRKWMLEHVKLNVEGRRYGMTFTGTGGELFVMGLVGVLLMIVTLYIYSFWFMAKMAKWQLSNTIIRSEGGAPAMGMGAPGMGVQQLGGPPPGQMPMGQPQQQLGGPQPQPGGYGAPPPGGPPMGGPPQGYA